MSKTFRGWVKLKPYEITKKGDVMVCALPHCVCQYSTPIQDNGFVFTVGKKACDTWSSDEYVFYRKQSGPVMPTRLPLNSYHSAPVPLP